MWLRISLLLGLWTGCVTASPSSHDDLLGVNARVVSPELPPLPRQPLRAPEGTFTGEVEAAGTPTWLRRENTWVLIVPLGTGSPLTCFVSAEPLDAGAALHRLLARVERTTRLERVRTTDMRLLGDTPVVYAEASYSADSPRGPVPGLIKLMVSSSERVPLACTHDEPGYPESFQRITSALVASLQTPAAPVSPPRYAAFDVLRVEGAPVGFERRLSRDAEGGGRLTRVVTSLFFPRSARQLLAQDTVSTELADAEGHLVSRDYARSIDGQVDLHVSLARVRGGEYHYEGRWGGKLQRGGFTTAEALAGEALVARTLRTLREAAAGTERTLQRYEPSRHPTAPLPQVLRSAGGGREVTAESGPLTATLTLDARGLVERMEVPLEGVRLVQERVSEEGNP